MLYERAYSPNTIAAYTKDVEKLWQHSILLKPYLKPKKVTTRIIKQCIIFYAKSGIALNTQHRLIKGIKSFFKYLEYADHITINPAIDLSYPKMPKLLPQTLHINEVYKLLGACKTNTIDGIRNRAIIETLYACGLRATELCTLKVSSYYPCQSFIRVVGKGNKERAIPISQSAIKWINRYITAVRNKNKAIQKGHEHIMFLNPRGRRFTRSNIASIVNKVATEADLKKKITPHTLRHSFATHLIQGGAPIHAVKDMLGHEAISSTEIYVKVDIEDLRDTLECYHPRFTIK